MWEKTRLKKQTEKSLGEDIQQKSGMKVQTPDGTGTILFVLGPEHPDRLHNPTGWQYADGTPVAPETVLYVVTLRLSHYAVYAEEEVTWN